jgi:hypothetical protein
MISFKRPRLVIVAVCTAAAFAVGGIAYASIPDSGGVIHGCYNTGSNPSAQLRVIDTSKGASCSKNEQALTWNQTGPQGPQGVQGAQGPQGPKGDTGAPGPTYSAGAGLALDGSTNTFAIQGSFQLPQGCSSGQTPFLLGTPLTHPWSCFTAANANESCDSGKFANGINADGNITCGAPSDGGTSAPPDVWVTGNGRIDAPNTDVGAIVGTLSLPAGAYLLNAKGQVEHDFTGLATSDYDIASVNCQLRENGTAVDSTSVVDQADGKYPSVPFTLSDVISSASPIAIELWCRGEEDGQHLNDVVLTALKVGTVNQQ